MFNFKKLIVYNKAKAYNKDIFNFINSHDLDRTTKDQLKRVSFSIMLNIAEGSGRFTNPDKRRFHVMARGSAFECAAVFDYLKDLNLILAEEFNVFHEQLDELSRIIFTMIKKLS